MSPLQGKYPVTSVWPVPGSVQAGSIVGAEYWGSVCMPVWCHPHSCESLRTLHMHSSPGQCHFLPLVTGKSYSSGLSPLVTSLSFQTSYGIHLGKVRGHEPHHYVRGSQVQRVPLEFSLRKAVVPLSLLLKCFTGWNLIHILPIKKTHITFMTSLHFHDVCCII